MMTRASRLMATAVVVGSVLLSGVGMAQAANDPGNGGGSPGPSAIAKKYKHHRSMLGSAQGGVKCGLVRGGCLQHYQKGSIYWSRATGAHFMVGAIREQWIKQGNENRFGYPKSDELALKNPAGAWQDFENARFHWSPTTGAHATFGGIGAKWDSTGRERGVLGFPTTGEIPGMRDGGVRQHFQHGIVYWTPRLGAHYVRFGPIFDSWAAGDYEHHGFGYGYPVADTQSWGQKFERGTIYNNHNQRAVDWAFRVHKGHKIPSIAGSVRWGGGKVPYKWAGGHGKIGPDKGGVDCSGFIRWVHHLSRGRDVVGGGGTGGYTKFSRVEKRDARPGDILLKSGHVLLVVRRINDSRFVVAEAPHTGTNVQIRERSVGREYTARRIG